MRRLFIIILVVIIIFMGYCCLKNKDDNLKDKYFQILKTNPELFWGVKINPRNTRNDTNRFYKFTLTINKKEKYVLPNFLDYGYSNLKSFLLQNPEKQYDLKKFAQMKRDNSYIYTEKFIKNIANEYYKSKAYEILSSPEIGRCVIFYLNENEYMAYVPDTNQVMNILWKRRFDKSHRLCKEWYYGKEGENN